MYFAKTSLTSHCSLLLTTRLGRSSARALACPCADNCVGSRRAATPGAAVRDQSQHFHHNRAATPPADASFQPRCLDQLFSKFESSGWHFRPCFSARFPTPVARDSDPNFCPAFRLTAAIFRPLFWYRFPTPFYVPRNGNLIRLRIGMPDFRPQFWCQKTVLKLGPEVKRGWLQNGHELGVGHFQKWCRKLGCKMVSETDPMEQILWKRSRQNLGGEWRPFPNHCRSNFPKWMGPFSWGQALLVSPSAEQALAMARTLF